MEKNDNKCCGGCCWFSYQVADGSGLCFKMADMPFCQDAACKEYVSREERDGYVELLERHNVWRRGSDEYPMAEPKELGEAIDFVIKYVKIFREI